MISLQLGEDICNMWNYKGLMSWIKINALDLFLKFLWINKKKDNATKKNLMGKRSELQGIHRKKKRP